MTPLSVVCSCAAFSETHRSVPSCTRPAIRPSSCAVEPVDGVVGDLPPSSPKKGWVVLVGG